MTIPATVEWLGFSAGRGRLSCASTAVASLEGKLLAQSKPNSNANGDAWIDMETMLGEHLQQKKKEHATQNSGWDAPQPALEPKWFNAEASDFIVKTLRNSVKCTRNSTLYTHSSMLKHRSLVLTSQNPSVDAKQSTLNTQNSMLKLQS